MTYYAAAYRTPDFIERAKTQTLSLVIRDGAGAAATVASGTLTLRDHAGTALVDGAAITAESDGSASYSLAAATVPATLAYSLHYTEEWDLTLSDGAKVNILRDAHLCRAKPQPRIDAADLLRRHTDLLTQHSVAQIQVFVDEAFDTLIGRMIGDAKYPQHILSAWSLAEPHMALALAYVFADLETYSQGAGRYASQRERYMERFERLWGRVNWSVDRDEDMTADQERESGDAVILLYDQPRGWRGGGW